MRPAVFIDRDGTINQEIGYINHISRFILLPKVAEAISLLNKHNRLVLITSNQSGVARGYFPIELVREINDRMIQTLKEENARIDGIYFCPHHPDGELREYKKACRCRKPDIGFIEAAQRDFDIDMKKSYVIGDRWLDIAFAHNAHLPGILVLTGYGRGEWEHVTPPSGVSPIYIAENLLEAVQWVLNQDSP
ncbi:MAG: D-glycero-alpha-D-manno-heptose-1,7-bisphosphate 7-phosphatase [Thermodesulfobacteriota bacterium]